MITTYSGNWWINYGGLSYDDYGIRIRPVKKIIGNIFLSKISRRKNFEYSIDSLDWLDSMCDVRVMSFDVSKGFVLYDTIPWDIGHTEIDYINSLVRSDNFVVYVVCYSSDGSKIGSPEFAMSIFRKGIEPQRINSEDDVSCIGYSIKTNSWWGWRGLSNSSPIKSYSIGDQMYKSMRYIDSIDEAKESAIRFVNQDC